MTNVSSDAPAAPGTASAHPFLHVPAGGGPAVWLNGDVYSVKLDKEESDGRLTVLEASVPPGGGPPIHNHTREEEAFYVLEGELEMYVAGRTLTVRTGDFVFVPRNTMHGFRNKGLHPARQLLLFTPGGFERFFLEAGEPAVPGIPVPPFRPTDNPRAVEVGGRHGSFQADAGTA
ncbi:quercetin 2,3-dioxygenase [Streptomyces sp. NPDC059506]|uniref:quercetin 2,3-dioxygenase n=1 Tax=Streptomyces sp. NPDC059506 TaxID=3347751 RepID=UPI0036A25ECA